MGSKKKLVVLFLLTLILVLFDQLSKMLVVHKLDHQKNYPILKGLISFEYLENRGVAFGLLSGKMSLISILVLFISLFIVFAIIILESSINQYKTFISEQTPVHTETVRNNRNPINQTNQTTIEYEQMNKHTKEENHINHTFQIKKHDSGITSKFTLLQIMLTCILSGSIGNIIDRMRLGYVIDFIKFDFFEFPTFNVADIYVTVSVMLLLILLLFVISEDELEQIKIRK